jgi:hypothetical protein
MCERERERERKREKFKFRCIKWLDITYRRILLRQFVSNEKKIWSKKKGFFSSAIF